MYTEESHSGFFSRIKNIFSAQQGASTTVLEKPNEEPISEVTERAIEPSVEEILPTIEVQPEEAFIVQTIEKSVSEPALQSLPAIKDLDIKFAANFIQQGGKFIYCETIREAVETIKAMHAQNGWAHVFSWEYEIKDAFCDYNFQKGLVGFTIENSEAAVSLCESLIAEDGSILFDPKQASTRKLHVFPKTHIILADLHNLTPNLLTGLERFHSKYKGELPSVFSLTDKSVGHFFDQSRLILRASGTMDVYVILIDELIPPSKRAYALQVDL